MQATKKLIERAERVIPGGSLTRSKKAFGVFAEHAEGALVWDTEGHHYIDCVSALGAATLGYLPAPSVSGVTSLRHRLEPEAAGAVLRYVAPWARWARFTKTGSEACTGAYRIAKAATGRWIVLRGDWSYHGWHPNFEEMPAEHKFQFGQTDLSEFDYIADGVAAVFIEPHRFMEPPSGWLDSIAAWCDMHGALLVFDSMIYGGRWALGGASEYFRIQPDLEVFGKGLGAGQSVAFIVGREETMPFGEIPSGTFSGDISGLAGVINALNIYRSEPVIETIWERGRQLQEGLLKVIPEHIGTVDGHYPVCQRILFHKERHAQEFTDAMLKNGVIWHPLVTLPNFAHTELQVRKVIEAAAFSASSLR